MKYKQEDLEHFIDLALGLILILSLLFCISTTVTTCAFVATEKVLKKTKTFSEYVASTYILGILEVYQCHWQKYKGG